MSRWKNLKRLMRMEGSVRERIGTAIFVIGGFYAGLWVGRLILNIF